MPVMRSIPLIINVEPDIKAKFKFLCEYENVTLDWAIQDLMSQCIDRNILAIGSNSPSQLSDHFADREIETLRVLAESYEELSKSFISLQKQISQLE